jgi:hypothetical protein
MPADGAPENPWGLSLRGVSDLQRTRVGLQSRADRWSVPSRTSVRRGIEARTQRYAVAQHLDSEIDRLEQMPIAAADAIGQHLCAQPIGATHRLAFGRQLGHRLLSIQFGPQRVIDRDVSYRHSLGKHEVQHLPARLIFLAGSLLGVRARDPASCPEEKDKESSATYLHNVELHQT